MSKPTERLFSEIEEKAKALNKKADTISAEIEAVNERLKSAGVGVEVWLDEPLDSKEWIRDETPGGEQLGEPASMRSDLHLGYAKVCNTWGLALRSDTWELTTDEDGDPDEILFGRSDVLLQNAGRSSRIIGFPHITKLLEAISKELSQKTEQLEQSGK